MKKKMKKKMLARKLTALVLCCLCLLMTIPSAVTTFATNDTQTVGEDAAVPEQPVAEAETSVQQDQPAAVSETEQNQPTAAPAEPQVTEAPAATEEDANVPTAGASDENTDAQPEEKNEETAQPTETPEATVTPEATQTPEATETPVPEKSAAEVLFDRLMACATYDEMATILNALTEEEKSLIDQFTEEQQNALEAKVAELGGYDVDTLDDSRSVTIPAGSSGEVVFNRAVGSNAKFTCSPSSKYITTLLSGKTVTITVDENAKADKYTLTYQYYVNKDDNSTWTINLTVPEQKTSTFNITNYLENTEVAYIDYQPEKPYALTPVSNGQTITGTATGSGDNGWGVLLFFIKPKDGYLLTEFKNSTGAACDLYSTTVSAGNSMIDYIRNNSVGEDLLNMGNNAGYLGYFGFTYNGNSGSASYTTKAECPQMTVTAAADPSQGVKPGDTVTYTVTITPGHTSTEVDKVTSIEINSLTINGEKKEYSELVSNSDGTYTTTVTHVVTDSDWEQGAVSLKVGAQVNYSYTITVKDRGLNGNDAIYSSILTTTTVPNTAEVSVPVAPKNPVRYSVSYEPNDVAIPEIIKNVPYDTTEYFAGDSVDVNNTYGTAVPEEGEPANEVDDPANGGTWLFDGWYKEEALTTKANVAETMIEGGLKFYGKWKFTPYPTTTITIQKLITGNMANENDSFAFVVSGNSVGEADKSFNLKHGEKKEITVRVGDTITVSENAGNYTPSYEVTVECDDGDRPVASRDDNSVTYTVTRMAGQTITFTNKYEVTIDTGISLDMLPYVIILAVLVLGGAAFVLKRRVREDD